MRLALESPADANSGSKGIIWKRIFNRYHKMLKYNIITHIIRRSNTID